MIVSSGGLALVLVFVLLAEASKQEQAERIKRPERVRILTTQDPRALGMDAVSARTFSLEKEQQRLKAENQRLQNKLKDLNAKIASHLRFKTDIAKLEARDKRLEEKLEKNKADIQKSLQSMLRKSMSDKLLMTSPKLASNTTKDKLETEVNVERRPHSFDQTDLFSYGHKATNQAVEEKQNTLAFIDHYTDERNTELILIVEDEIKTQNADDKAASNPIYLPQGAILTGVLITGMDAPTNASAQETPYPSLVRIKKEAILPNYQVLQEVEECFALLGGYGDLSSERVMFRGEGISCISHDGSVIETKFSAYAVGEDAKAGLRGRLVTRNSKVLVNAMLSGFASGLASAFGTNPVPVIATEADSEQQYQEIFSSSAVQGGVAKGASNAMERLADYYMELADATHPVIEISSGRVINIVVTKGAML